MYIPTTKRIMATTSMGMTSMDRSGIAATNTSTLAKTQRVRHTLP